MMVSKEIRPILRSKYSIDEAPEGCGEILQKIAEYKPSSKHSLTEQMYRSGVVVGIHMACIEPWSEDLGDIQSLRVGLSISQSGEDLCRGIQQVYYWAFKEASSALSWIPTHDDLRVDIKQYLQGILDWLNRDIEGEDLLKSHHYYFNNSEKIVMCTW